MKTKLMALMLLAGGAVFAQPRIAIGVQIGRPAPVAVVEGYRPPCPGEGYVWIEGYYDEFGNWIEGYWDLPPYVGAYWIAPRVMSGRFIAGYWGGPRGVYYGAPRYAPPRVYERGYYDRGGYDRGYVRPAPERYEHRSYDRGNYDRGYRDHGGDRGYERGNSRGGGFEHGYRR